MQTNPVSVRYFTKSALIHANNNGKQVNNKNVINDDDLQDLAEDKVFPISEHHADGTNIRATVVLNEYGHEVDIDISYNVWENLPTKTISASV